jgi:hypothetical protein
MRECRLLTETPLRIHTFSLFFFEKRRKKVFVYNHLSSALAQMDLKRKAARKWSTAINRELF